MPRTALRPCLGHYACLPVGRDAMDRLLDALMAYSNKVELQATSIGIGPLMWDVDEEGTVVCSRCGG